MPDRKKIKILCLIGQLGNGGSEKQLYLFLKHLDRDAYEPELVVSSAEAGGRWQDIIRNDLKVKTHFLSSSSKPVKMLKYFSILMRARPELIFSWSFYTNAFHAFDFGKKFIGSLRNQISSAKAGLSSLHFNKSLSPDFFIVNSELLKMELCTCGVSTARVFPINNIFEIDAAYEAGLSGKKADVRKQYGIEDDEILVAGVGRNAPEKDFQFFVKVFAEACRTNNNLKAILIGSGGLAVKGEIDSLGLSGKFIITGEIPSAKEVIPCADIFFLSSIYEGMPNVVLEAIEAGCAVLTMDVGGVRDILGEDNPYFSDMVASCRDIRKASGMLLKLVDNRDLRMKISAYNRDFRLENFTNSKIMPKYYQLFETVLSA